MMAQCKKLTAWLLTLAMLFTMLPSFTITAWATDNNSEPDPVTTYPLWVNNIQVTSANCSDVLGDADGEGATVSYNPATNTLNLANAMLSEECNNINIGSVIYTEQKQLNIYTSGTNSIGSDSAPVSCGILWTYDMQNADSLCLSGSDGTLNIYSTTEGIYVSGGNDVVIRSGNINVTASATGGSSHGIYTDGNVVIEDGNVNVTASATGGSSHGIYTGGNVVIQGGETVVVQGDYQAFTREPTIAEGFDAAVWYGENEADANTAGPKNKSKLADDYHNQKYVRIVKTIKESTPTPAQPPIDYVAETLIIDSKESHTYHVYLNDELIAEHDNNIIPITDGMFNETVQVITAARNEAYADSDPVAIRIPRRPDAPNVLVSSHETMQDAKDGKMSGLVSTAVYQYRLRGANEWKKVGPGDTEITGLAGGVYEIRLAAVPYESFAGEINEFNIQEGKLRVYDVSVEAGFPSKQIYGDHEVSASVSLTNNGNTPVTITKIELLDADGNVNNNFTAVAHLPIILAKGDINESIIISPIPGLDAGDYSVIVRITAENDIRDEFYSESTTTFTVQPRELLLNWENITDRTLGDNLAVYVSVDSIVAGDDVYATVVINDGSPEQIGENVAEAILAGAASSNYKLPYNYRIEYGINCDEHVYIPGEYVWDYDWDADYYSCTVTGTCSCGDSADARESMISFEQTVAPTCTEKGENTYTASFAESWAAVQTKTEDVDALGHTYGDLIQATEEIHTQTTLTPGVAAHYICSVCDTYFTEDKAETTLADLTGETPVHSDGSWINTDVDKHWKECSCGLKDAEGVHIYANDADTSCDTCGYVRIIAHEHTFASTLSYDANNHWYAATCGHNVTRGLEAHHGGTATCKDKAVCVDCGQAYGDLADHEYGTLISAQAAVHTQTELKAGVAAHYICDVCDTYFTEGKAETTLADLTGETPVHSDGDDADTLCDVCGLAISRQLTGITVTKQPNKVEYKAGEVFDPAGMIVTAAYSDNTEAVITDYTVSPSGKLTAEDTAVTISCTENDITKTATVVITVIQKKIVKNELETVPNGLKGTEFDTVDKIVDELTRVLITEGGSGYSAANTETFDVKLQFMIDGEWVDATTANFPAGGLEVVLPYPDGTGKDTHDFTVTHMFTADFNGYNAGETETPHTDKQADGIHVTLNGLSPVGVAWKEIASVTPPADDSFDYDMWYWTLMMLYNQEFDITATTTEGGTITPAGVTKVKYSKDQLYTITPAEGYMIEEVIVDGKSIGAVEVYNFDNVRKDHTIIAVFAEIPWQNPFTDVTEADWFYKDVQFVSENGLMLGSDTEGTLFSPDKTLTRAMLVTILWRAAGQPLVDSPVDFFDVPADQWYSDAIAWASANGIVLGYGDGTFGTNDLITREQLATILYRYEQLLGGGFTGMWMFPLRYDDAADAADWAYEAMCWLTMNDIYVTHEGDLLDSKEKATRAETAAFLRRFCEYREEQEEQ